MSRKGELFVDDLLEPRGFSKGRGTACQLTLLLSIAPLDLFAPMFSIVDRLHKHFCSCSLFLETLNTLLQLGLGGRFFIKS